MSTRREISKEYKERRLRGGVYTITNTRSGKYLIGHAANLASVRNRFDFAVTTGSAVHPKLRTDWEEAGDAVGSVFRLDVLEELEQRPDQTQAEFMEDLKTLEQLHRADLDPSNAY